MPSPIDIHNKPITEILSLFKKADEAELIGSYQLRDKYIVEYGFWLLAKESLETLSRLTGDGIFIELMAGSGYVSRELSKHGHRVYACDNYSTKYQDEGKWEIKGKSIVSNIDWRDFLIQNKTLVRHKDAIIFVSWPFMDDGMFQIARFLKRKSTKFRGRLLYVGEHKGGCTANDKFFKNFTLKELDENRNYSWPYEYGDISVSFTGLHDQLFEVYPEKPDEHED